MANYIELLAINQMLVDGDRMDGDVEGCRERKLSDGNNEKP